MIILFVCLFYVLYYVKFIYLFHFYIICYIYCHFVEDRPAHGAAQPPAPSTRERHPQLLHAVRPPPQPQLLSLRPLQHDAPLPHRLPLTTPALLPSPIFLLIAFFETGCFLNFCLCSFFLSILCFCIFLLCVFFF